MASMLLDGRHKSCGCLKREQVIERSTKHGHKTRAGTTPTWNSWMNMLRRCENPDHPRYADWGGRGITVCERWHDFAAFLADMGEKPPGLTLERKNNNGPYSPDNCCWDTHHAQRVNRRTWLTPEAQQVILDMRARGCLLREIGESLGVSRQAVSRALRSQQRTAGMLLRAASVDALDQPAWHGAGLPRVNEGPAPSWPGANGSD